MENIKFIIEKSSRIQKLVDDLYSSTPEIEPARGVLITESYKMTEDLPAIKRRSAAFAHILKNLPIVIRDNELVVGSSTVVPRSCQIYPEYSYEWLEGELDSISTREADPFYISEETKKTFRELFPYWKGKTCSDLAKANMLPEAFTAFAEHSVYTPGNYFYNGIGHVSVAYNKVLSKGYRGIIEDATSEIAKLDATDADYINRTNFLTAVIESCEAAIEFAHRYSRLAAEMAAKEKDSERRAELEKIAKTSSFVRRWDRSGR